MVMLNSGGSMTKVSGENGGAGAMKMALVSPTPVTVAKALVKLVAPIVPLPVVVKLYVIGLALQRAAAPSANDRMARLRSLAEEGVREIHIAVLLLCQSGSQTARSRTT